MSRTERVASLLKKEIADILHRKINDIRIGFITITSIKISPDLTHAWVYYSQIGSEEQKQITKKGLASATKFIKLEIGKVLTTQVVPNIHFQYDDTLERAQKLIEKIDALSDQ